MSARAGEIVLGVDPGLTCTGWGIVREVGNKFVYVESGRIRTKPVTPMAERISEIYVTLQGVVNQYDVTRGAVEAGYVGKGALSALKLGQARAAAVLALHQSGIPVCDLSPREVKLAVVGKGSASKEQVSYMVGQLLGLQFDPGEADISDALGIAITAGYLARRIARGVPA